LNLTNAQVKAIKCPDEKKTTKLFDGNGLYLLINKTGSKLWRMRFKYTGKHQELALGKYPTTSLSEARELSKGARKLLDQGINPAKERRERKTKMTSVEMQFKTVALSWWAVQQDSWSDGYAAKVEKWLTEESASICDKPIDQIKVSDITQIMLELKKAGHPKKAPPILSVLNRVFGYALGKELTETNPAQNLPLKDIIGRLPRVKHRAAITESNELSKLINDIDSNLAVDFCSIEALKLIPRVFLRPGEVRNLRWEYVYFDEKLICIPSVDMKMERDHLVPLADQVVEQLKNLKRHTGYSTYLFPNQKSADKPISKNVLTNRLRELGYPADIMSAHGFRSTASTILHEHEWSHDYIEMQLSHIIGTSSSRPYNRAKYLKQRREMMQFWADFLDELKMP
jgi:integrase